MHREAQRLIDGLGLQKHPEGGYFRETYRTEETIAAENLPDRFQGGARSFATAIYFLLADGDFSAFHRIKSDETWHFYAGGPLVIHELDDAGNHVQHLLGNIDEGTASFQVTVKAGTWFGASLAEPCSYALVGCTVSPGFDFRDFEMAKRDELQWRYPQHGQIIEKLTRDCPPVSITCR